MATDLKSHASNVSMTRFWGGKNKGSCVQVTQPRKDTNLDLNLNRNLNSNLHLNANSFLGALDALAEDAPGVRVDDRILPARVHG